MRSSHRFGSSKVLPQSRQVYFTIHQRFTFQHCRIAPRLARASADDHNLALGFHLCQTRPCEVRTVGGDFALRDQLLANLISSHTARITAGQNVQNHSLTIRTLRFDLVICFTAGFSTQCSYESPLSIRQMPVSVAVIVGQIQPSS